MSEMLSLTLHIKDWKRVLWALDAASIEASNYDRYKDVSLYLTHLRQFMQKELNISDD